MPLDLSFPCFLSMRPLLAVIHFFIHFVRLFPTIFCSNNCRRLWCPMMNELRKRQDLAKRDPLPCEVLDTFPDAPRHPYDDISSIYCPSQAPEDPPHPPLQICSQSELFQAPEVTPLSVAPAVATAALQPQDHEDVISSDADSVAAAAMMLMTGGRASSPAKNAMNSVECIDSADQGGNNNEPKELSQRVVTSPVIEAKASKLSTSWQVMIGGKLGSYEKVKRMTPEAERSSGTMGAGNDGFRMDSQISGGRGIDCGLVKAGPTWTTAGDGGRGLGVDIWAKTMMSAKAGRKTDALETKADAILLKDDGMKGSGVGESVVS